MYHPAIWHHIPSCMASFQWGAEPLGSDKQPWLFLAGSTFKVDSLENTLTSSFRDNLNSDVPCVIKPAQYTS